MAIAPYLRQHADARPQVPRDFPGQAINPADREVPGEQALCSKPATDKINVGTGIKRFDFGRQRACQQSIDEEQLRVVAGFRALFGNR